MSLMAFYLIGTALFGGLSYYCGRGALRFLKSPRTEVRVFALSDEIDRTGKPVKYWMAVLTFGLSSFLCAGAAVAMFLGLLFTR